MDNPSKNPDLSLPALNPPELLSPELATPEVVRVEGGVGGRVLDAGVVGRSVEQASAKQLRFPELLMPTSAAAAELSRPE